MVKDDNPIKSADSEVAAEPSKNLERLSDIGTIASVAGALISASVALPIGLPVMLFAAVAALGAGGAKIAASRAKAAKAEEAGLKSSDSSALAKNAQPPSQPK